MSWLNHWDGSSGLLRNIFVFLHHGPVNSAAAVSMNKQLDKFFPKWEVSGNSKSLLGLKFGTGKCRKDLLLLLIEEE